MQDPLPTRALVRAPIGDLSGALTRDRQGPVACPATASRQHIAYVRALESMGLKVERLPPLDGHPDAHFVEDTAVVLGQGKAIIARPGAPARRGETATVASALSRHLDLLRIEAPGTLDGGDVLRVGERLYVGRSSRTNGAGIAQLSEAASSVGVEVVAMRVRDALHLKSVATALTDSLILAVEGAFEVDAFAPATVVTLPEAQAHAANVLRLGEQILMAADCPEAAALVERHNLSVKTVDTREFRKMDGALTCLSILF